MTFGPVIGGRMAASGPFGLLIDQLLGEPPDRLHPVALLGRGLGQLEQHTYRDQRSNGVAHLTLAVVPVSLAALVSDAVFGRTATAASIGVASAGEMLRGVAMTVAHQLERGDLEAARRELVSLVGRDATELDESEIIRAVVESVAENTVDAVTATLFWGAIGGSPGVWVHRTVNTLDAMVGHRSYRYQRFGWASARMDDAMNWPPARLTAVVVAAVVPHRAGAVLRTALRDGRKHPSPNGGVVEAAFAGALDITLGGTNDYGGTVEVRGPLGDGPPPSVADIARAVTISRRASWAFSGLMLAVSAIFRRPRLS